MIKHRLTLNGGHGQGLRVPAAILQEALAALLEGARCSVRLLVEGESVRKGPRPTWLDAACAIEVTSLSNGSAVITVEAPRLAQADARFAPGHQPTLFEDRFPHLQDRTAIDLFARILATVVEDLPEELFVDRAALGVAARFARIGGGEFDSVQLDGLQGRDRPLLLTPSDATKFVSLRDTTPPPQALRVAGILDTISASRSDVTLTLQDSTKVLARLEEHDAPRLQELFGVNVVVSGVAHFGPAGRLLFVSIESLEPARAADRLFTTLPPPAGPSLTEHETTQDDTSGVSRLFGTWPGDETEGELLDALRSIE